MVDRNPQASLRGVPAEVAREIEMQIRGRLGGRVSDLRVVARGDGLALLGRSRTHHARQLAQQLAMEATELPILANEIRV